MRLISIKRSQVYRAQTTGDFHLLEPEQVNGLGFFLQAENRCLTPTSTKVEFARPNPRNKRFAHGGGGAGSAQLFLPSFKAM